MRKKFLFLLLVLFTPYRPPIATESLIIPHGSVPTLDGEPRDEEWNDAVGIDFPVEDKVAVQVRLKHDGDNLYLVFSFSGNQDSAFFKTPGRSGEKACTRGNCRPPRIGSWQSH